MTERTCKGSPILSSVASLFYGALLLPKAGIVVTFVPENQLDI